MWRTGLLAPSLSIARRVGVPIAVVVLAMSGCGDDDQATEFARDYLRAAVEGDVKRLCGLRTDGALRRWGGQGACERHAEGLAIDPLPPTVSQRLRQDLRRKALAVNPRAARVVPDDTSITGDQARVVIDFGNAMIEEGHAVGGEILEMDLESQDGDLKVTRLGFATFAD